MKKIFIFVFVLVISTIYVYVDYSRAFQKKANSFQVIIPYFDGFSESDILFILNSFSGAHWAYNPDYKDHNYTSYSSFLIYLNTGETLYTIPEITEKFGIGRNRVYLLEKGPFSRVSHDEYCISMLTNEKIPFYKQYRRDCLISNFSIDMKG